MTATANKMLQRNIFIIVTFLATAVSAHSRADDGTYLLGRLVIGLAINGAMALIGYYACDFQATGAWLIFFFGWFGCCCACAMGSRSKLKERAQRQQGFIIVQQQPVSTGDAMIVRGHAGQIGGQYFAVPSTVYTTNPTQTADLPPNYEVATQAPVPQGISHK